MTNYEEKKISLFISEQRALYGSAAWGKKKLWSDMNSNHISGGVMLILSSPDWVDMPGDQLWHTSGVPMEL